MCGIAGTINQSSSAADVLRSMQHRGPDDQTSTVIQNVQLFHARLAIIDAVGGKQPMRRDNLIVTYNGEIYNHLELRSRFNLLCDTHSDTETLLALFAKMGTSCFEHLDGMFAFALFDEKNKQLYLVRDRAGEKPLYIKKRLNTLQFASELNTLNVLDRLEIDDTAVNSFLSSGIFFQQRTAYHDVFECPAGSFVQIDSQSLQYSVKRWFKFGAAAQQQSLSIANKSPESLSSTIDAIDTLLHESVKDRLLSSDVEVGAFLSGGIDSGLITAIASEYTEKLKTFTVSFDGQFDESALADQVAKKYQTQHHVLKVDYADLDQNIERILLNYGEPICDDSVIPTWYVSKAAHEHVSVVLTGDGADELFGGYRRYVPYANFQLFNSTPASSMAASLMLQFMPQPRNKMGNYSYAYRFLSLLKNNGLDRYIATTTNLDTSGLLLKQHDQPMVLAYDELTKNCESSLSNLMQMDFHTLLAGALLPKMDIGTMAHSLEGRSPFLSAKLLDLSPMIANQFKINGRVTKYALRQLSQKYLPKELQNAPKRGFETPLNAWLTGKLKPLLNDLLANPNAYVRQFYKANYIDALLANKQVVSGLQRDRTLWMLFCVEVWSKKYVH